MLNASRLPLLLLALSTIRLGCHAQTPAPAPVAPAAAAMQGGTPLAPALAYRIETLIRRKAGDLPPMSDVNLSGTQPSDIPGFRKLFVTISNDGHTSHPIEFLVSDDGKTLQQLTTFDISADPRTSIPFAGRPARGGSEAAPVIIVGFDDLECPYCAKLHATIFPAITERYGDKVHIVYRDYPLDMHPWAMRAAVDVNCLGAQSPAAYWSAVDAIHAQSSTIGTDPANPKADRTMAFAEKQLDSITREQGSKAKVDETKLNACITKQDTAQIQDETHLAQSLNLSSTPVLFINGNKTDGAIPIDFIFAQIDKALRAQGVTPPPAYVPLAPPAAKPKA